jgi:hypothetical protein
MTKEKPEPLEVKDARRLREFQKKIAKLAYAAKAILSPDEIATAFFAITVAVMQESVGEAESRAWMRRLLEELVEEPTPDGFPPTMGRA